MKKLTKEAEDLIMSNIETVNKNIAYWIENADKKISKEVFNWDKLLEVINKHTGRNFQLINNKVRAKYKATLKQGYTKENIMAAIQNAPKTQYHIENNCLHLTPEFFSRPDKIDMYASIVNTDSEKISLKMNT